MWPKWTYPRRNRQPSHTNPTRIPVRSPASSKHSSMSPIVQISRHALMFTFALLLVSSHEVRRAEAMRAMPMKTLLLAQLDGKQVVGHSASTATGTGAFVLDPARHTVTYDLTYQGLESGGARSIALHNFGAGKTG